MTGYRTLFFAAAFLLTAATGGVAADQPGAPEADDARVSETIRSMYAALATDDNAKFRSVTASDFYAFDGGERYTAAALMDLIKTAHTEGKVYAWTVNEPDVHISGDTAWIAYVSNGWMKDASGKKEVTWLESAFLQRQGGVWRIQFLHSTRAPAVKSPKS